MLSFIIPRLLSSFRALLVCTSLWGLGDLAPGIFLRLKKLPSAKEIIKK